MYLFQNKQENTTQFFLIETPNKQKIILNNNRDTIKYEAQRH